MAFPHVFPLRGPSPHALTRRPAPVAVLVCALVAASAGPAAAQGAAVRPPLVPSAPATPPSPPAPLPPVGGADVARMVAPAASSPAADPAADGWTARSLVRMFLDACLAGEARQQPAVDWAISHGFVPLDAAAPGARTLLDDRAGAVFSPVGHEGRVMLAVVDGTQCIVWSDRAGGPSMRLALLQALGERRGRGETVEVAADRRIERAGAWRQQSVWRWRRPGGSGEWSVGLVHTLTDTPAAQVLRLAPHVPASALVPAQGPAVTPGR